MIGFRSSTETKEREKVVNFFIFHIAGIKVEILEWPVLGKNLFRQNPYSERQL